MPLFCFLRRKLMINEKIILSDCEYDSFYHSMKLVEELGGKIIAKVDGFGTLYWDVLFLGTIITFCYNIYEGISMYLESEKYTSSKDITNVNILFEKLKSAHQLQ